MESASSEFTGNNQSFEDLWFARARAIALCSLAPLLHHLALHVYAFQVWFVAGQCPMYNKPDPVSAGWPLQHLVLTLGFVGSIFGPLFSTIIGVAMWRHGGLAFPWRFVLLGVISFGAAMVYTSIDPFGVCNSFRIDARCGFVAEESDCAALREWQNRRMLRDNSLTGLRGTFTCMAIAGFACTAVACKKPGATNLAGRYTAHHPLGVSTGALRKHASFRRPFLRYPQGKLLVL